MLSSLAPLALLALQLPNVLASEAGCHAADEVVEMVQPAYDAADQVVLANATAFTVDFDPLTSADLAPGLEYLIDCKKYPAICQNWCYYIFCKPARFDDALAPKAWTVTVDRGPNRRLNNECGKYERNKCSPLPDRKGSPWPANPAQGLDCDDQPKANTLEGGAGAATRCIDSNQIRSENTDWDTFINKPGKVVPNGSKVLVRLRDHGGAGICAAFTQKPTDVCPEPASPEGANVKKDPTRQQ